MGNIKIEAGRLNDLYRDLKKSDFEVSLYSDSKYYIFLKGEPPKIKIGTIERLVGEEYTLIIDTNQPGNKRLSSFTESNKQYFKQD
jgi:hypothetical protein